MAGRKSRGQFPGCRDGAAHGHEPPLPGRMKYRLFFFRCDRAKALHPAQIMYAVHGLPPADSTTLATQIIESRVTRAASASSFMSSVPAGRSGRTK